MPPSLGLKSKIEVSVADHSIIGKLRSVVEPPGKKGLWLRHLDDKQLVEVYHRLKLNHSVMRIIKIIQKDWGILPESTPKSLSRAMRVFRNEVVGLLKAHERSFPITPQKKAFVAKEEKRAELIIKKIDGMQELAWLIQTQRGRLEVMVDRERVGLPSKYTDRTVAELRECVNTYLEHAEELGLIDVKPKELNLHLKSQFDGLLENIVQDDGSRLISAASRFLELAEKKAIPMKRVTDGSYVPEGNSVPEMRDENDGQIDSGS